MTPGVWTTLARDAVAAVGTPCFVLTASGVRTSLDELRQYTARVRARHWLSVKTQPVKPLLTAWREWGLDVEVVSPFELDAALDVGFPPERILVNGTGKHRWLPAYPIERLNVHFDSVHEVRELTALAARCRWHVGVRSHVTTGTPGTEPDHFGIDESELDTAIVHLEGGGVPVRGIHFHIGSNATVDAFAAAAGQVRAACDRAAFEPGYVDVGGGLPVAGERPWHGTDSEPGFDFARWADWLATVPSLFPRADAVWLENGRFMTARAGVLAVTILDRKQRDGAVYLVCDGGRTNHARMSAIEEHAVIPDPRRTGPACRTVLCGPTCGAVDRLGTFMLPADLTIGDQLLWTNAGAYAIPLETRFSFGLAPVVWYGCDGQMQIARPRESAAVWWGQWR